MIVPATFATVFARTLDLFRDPAAKEDQKIQFRALVNLMKADGVTLRVNGERLIVNGIAVEGAIYHPVVQRLTRHAVREIVITADPPAGQVFEFLKALSEDPGSEDLAARLRARGADSISASIVTPKLELGTEGILHGGDATDMAPADAVEAPKPGGGGRHPRLHRRRST